MTHGSLLIRTAGLALLLGVSIPAHATFHLYRVDQIYSNADGSAQFIDFFDPAVNDQDDLLTSQAKLTVAQGGATHTYLFPNNLPSAATANTHFLVATPGYAALPGAVVPDYVVPDHFLFTDGGTIRYFSDFTGEFGDEVAYGALPTDGVHSITRTGVVREAVATNFAGDTAAVAVPEPGNALLLGVGLMVVLAWTRPRGGFAEGT